MKMTTSLLLCTVLLSLASQTIATQKCNLYNFIMQGGYKCGLEWWKARDLGQLINVKYKVSDIVEKSLTKWGTSVDQINQRLQGKIAAESTDPLGKIIESVLTIEPYFTYAVSDLILGMGITKNDLRLFRLPEDLAERKNLIKMFTDYMKVGCSSYGIRPLVTCMENWMAKNCDATEDNTQVIVDLLNTMRDAYCAGTAVAKPSLIRKLTADLGTVYKTIPEFFGIYKDSSSPYLFNIRKDSVLYERDLWQRTASRMQQECGYLTAALTTDISSVFSASATAGAGHIVEGLVRANDAASRCTLRVLHQAVPGLFTKNKKAFEHMDIARRRYGNGKMSYEETNVATEERHSVMVFGDPHMVPYKATKTVTCPAIGVHIYLSNEYFTLKGRATPVSSRSQATYVTQVGLVFSGKSGRSSIKYQSGAGKLSSSLIVNGRPGSTKAGDVKIVSLGDSVQITDLKSGAVFGLRKYRDTYYFTVRVGAKVLDGSLGLLATGCPTPVSINKGRTRRSTKCQTACTAAPAVYRDTCNYDCTETGDTGVAQISRGMVSLKNQVEKKDSGVLQSLRADACQHLPNLIPLLILSFFVRYF